VSTGGRPLDWALLYRAFKDASDWVLDVAAHTARNYPDEVAAVERVRRFLRARSAGRRARVRADDLLFTFGLMLAAIERDLGPLRPRPLAFAAPAAHADVRHAA
jgi:hypothetical protein